MFFFYLYSIICVNDDSIPFEKSQFTDGEIANRRVQFSDFTFYANSPEYVDERGTRYPVDQAFDYAPNLNTYFVPKYVNNETFQNSITINFKKSVQLESILFGPAYSTKPEGRVFYGLPLRVDVYGNRGDDPMELISSFSGDRPTTREWSVIQYRFRRTIEVENLRLVFSDITFEDFFSHSFRPAIGRIDFIGLSSHNNLISEKASGFYAQDSYVNSHIIPRANFVPTFNGQDQNGNPLENAFNGNDQYWSGSAPNTEGFTNQIEVVFNEQTKLDAILYDPAYSTQKNVDRRFDGFPLKLNIYTSETGDSYVLDSVFTGAPSGSAWGRTQFVFKYPVSVKKIKLEFAQITPNLFFADGVETPAAQRIYFLKADDSSSSSLPFYSEFNIENRVLKPNTDFSYSSDGDTAGRSLQGAIETDSGYWVPSNPNTNSFKNSIYVNFVKTTSFQGISLGNSYQTRNGQRIFHGFASTLKIYASLKDEPLRLQATFSGDVPTSTSWDRTFYILKNPIKCDQMRIEFTEVTNEGIWTNENVPCARQIKLIKGISMKSLSFRQVQGIYADPNYLEDLLVTPTEKTANHQRSSYEVDKAFDGNPNTRWYSNTQNKETVHSYIIVKFDDVKTLDTFLIDPYVTTRDGARVYEGFPTSLNLYVSEDGNNFNIYANYAGEITDDMTRMQFRFSDPTKCKALKLEFVKVVPESSDASQQFASVVDILFVREPDSLSSNLPDGGDITSSCNLKYRCEVKENEERENYEFEIQQTSFVNYNTRSSGGALCFINTGLKINSPNFQNCVSHTGGGAIFFKNQYDNNNKLTVNGATFTECKALYGGAIFSYSLNTDSEIKGCTFVRCSLIETVSGYDGMKGGSAIYLQMDSGCVKSNKFDHCKGNILRLDNSYQTASSLVTLSNKRISQKVLVIDSNIFETDKNAESSIYYQAGANGNSYKVSNCIFRGTLKRNGHFIDGVSTSNNAPKLLVQKCSFACKPEIAFNMNINSLSVDLKNQDFIFDEKATERPSQTWKIVVATVVPALDVVICISVIALVIAKRRKNKNQVQENEISVDEPAEKLLDQALI